MTKEIRSTNSAMSLAFDSCSSVMALKRQHLLQLLERYKTIRSAVFTAESERIQGLAASVPRLQVEFDLQTFQRIELPLDVLRDHVFERLSIVGRPLSLVTIALQTAGALNEMIMTRNRLIGEFRGRTLPENMVRYFGLPLGLGQVDSSYPDVVTGICDSADDVIFYTSLL